MGETYKTIDRLCNQRGIKIGRLCADLGISRGLMGNLKAGRSQELSVPTATKIADYFGVSLSYLMGIDESAASATVNGDEELTDYLQMLYERSECRMLFSLAKDASREDVELAVSMIEALRKKGKNEADA